jgi:hypothetical protein
MPIIDPQFALSEQQHAGLVRLGWQPPGPDTKNEPNWWQIFPLGTDSRFAVIASAVLRTLTEVYGYDDHDLKISLAP